MTINIAEGFMDTSAVNKYKLFFYLLASLLLGNWGYALEKEEFRISAKNISTAEVPCSLSWHSHRCEITQGTATQSKPKKNCTSFYKRHRAFLARDRFLGSPLNEHQKFYSVHVETADKKFVRTVRLDSLTTCDLDGRNCDPVIKDPLVDPLEDLLKTCAEHFTKK